MRDGAEEDLKRRFPRLATTRFEVTSGATTDYNCLAWVLGDQDVWISPVLYDEDQGLFPWPQGVPRENTIDAWMLALEAYGFARCEDGALEPGQEKAAVYWNAETEVIHFARQLASGLWTSKIGQWEDVSHELE
ncbi:MAG: hypothetical protein LC667_07480, partial [Thioalkalivibrio sp.]|nr:hypothetical protein [Thioalkalivibrio sp.]